MVRRSDSTPLSLECDQQPIESVQLRIGYLLRCFEMEMDDDRSSSSLSGNVDRGISEARNLVDHLKSDVDLHRDD